MIDTVEGELADNQGASNERQSRSCSSAAKG